MNSLLDSFHSISLPGVIFPKGLKLYVVISIPSRSTCIVIVGSSRFPFTLTFTDILSCCFSFLASTNPRKTNKQKPVANKIRVNKVCSIKQLLGIFPIIFLLFYNRKKQNYKFVQNIYCFLFGNVTIFESCTPQMTLLFIKLLNW